MKSIKLNTILALFLLTAACGDDTDSQSKVERSELQSALGGDEPASNDIIDGLCERVGAAPGCDLCEELDFYDDGVCDDFCPSADIDCDGQTGTDVQPGLLSICTTQDLADAGFDDPLTIDSVQIDDKDLVLSVGYSGGCETHEFAACWSGQLDENGNAEILIGHNGNNDMCEAYPQHDVTFDISALGDVDATVSIAETTLTAQYNGASGNPTTTDSDIVFCDDAMIADFQSAGFEIVDTVDALAIDGDELVVDVSYSGGCETHQFQLCSQGIVLESFPTQSPLMLLHNPNGDSCEAFIQDELRFGLGVMAGEQTYLQVGGQSVLYQP